MKKLFDKKRKNKGFSLVELIVVVAIMAVLMAVLVPTLVRNVEKSRKQKDKSALGELRQAIVTAMNEESCLYATASTTGATAASGTLTIADLFGDSTTTGKGDASGGSTKDKDTTATTNAAASNAAIISEVTTTIGAPTITLSSKYVGCTVVLQNFDPASGTVVMVVTDDDAPNFYIDQSGDHDGDYGTTKKN